ncbi:DUF4011 domain-containing protein, partial [Candidatus Bathyarchaeota archaeon]|nr:DUF4011 domain-containing protein [Candidatus Bathyarchaeota archaeon]
MDNENMNVLRRVNEWKLKLIDLSRRNQLIYFTPRSSVIELISPDLNTIYSRLVKGREWKIFQPALENPLAFEKQDKLIRLKSREELIPSVEDPKILERALRNLYRRSISEYRERGVRILYVTLANLKWRELESAEEIKSPLLLIPVEIVKERPHEPYKIRVPDGEEALILNPALALKLKNDYKIELPQPPDPEELNIQVFFEKITASAPSLGWSIEPKAHLGLFSFYKLVIYKDLEEHTDKIVKHPIVRALAGVNPGNLVRDHLPKEEDLDRILEPHNIFQVLDADSSQQLCIQYALTGQSFVMHGPPGTGKSQTIANIISESIAAGKSVLFVSEKMAALEVVYNRLRECGLDEFCLELHSQKANKREVVAELGRSLTEHLKPGRGISEAEIENLRERRDRLNSYVEALHKERLPIEASAFELLTYLNKLRDIPFVNSNYPYFGSLTPKKLLELDDLIRRLMNVWQVVEEEDFPWKGCKASTFTSEIKTEWISLLEDSISALNQLMREAESYARKIGLNPPKIMSECEWLGEVSGILKANLKPPSSWFEEYDLTQLERKAEKNRVEYSTYWTRRRSLEQFYDGRFLRLPLGRSRELEIAYDRLAEVLNISGDNENFLFESSEEFSSYLKKIPEKLKTWKETALKLSSMLGLSINCGSISEIRDVCEVSCLSGEKIKPEASWLNKEKLKEARRVFEEAKRDYLRLDYLRGELKEYKEDLLKLDLDNLIEWLEGPGSSSLRYFRPKYYEIKRVLSNANKMGRMPKSILNDLKMAKELRLLEEKVKSRRETIKKTLLSYSQAPRPDFDSADKALKIAERALRTIRTGKASEALIKNLSKGGIPDEALIKTSRELRDALTAWLSETKKFEALIPLKKMSKTGRPLLRSPLEDVSSWAEELNERLVHVITLSADALATRISKHPPNYRRLISDLREAEALQTFESTVEALREENSKDFGRKFRGIDTDWDEIKKSIDWTRKVRSILRSEVPKPLIAAVSEEAEEDLQHPDFSLLEKVYSAIDAINERFEKPLWKDPKSLDLFELESKLMKLLSRIEDLRIWVDYKDLERSLEEAGLGRFRSELVQRRVGRSQLLDYFHKSIYQGLVERIFREDPFLENFRGQDHEQLISEFRRLDRKFVELSSSRVIRKANELRPQGLILQAPDSEITILQREAMKKRKHLPIRDLFDRIPNLLRRLKPCLMMSPISVSQFLIPEKLHFDLVVFDEASQIYTEDAIGAVYRGDQLIVAGDNKQLPPTPFFKYTLDEDFDWDEEAGYEFDVFDSVLDECMAIGLPVNMLRWHYRSKHDALINFSNERFYDKKLILFPSSYKYHEDLGVRFVYVPDGIYDRGGARNNLKEAEVVADLVFSHFKDHPEKSLGVVTFNLSQMNTIQDIIEQRRAENPEFEQFFVENRLHGFFVKNLENVQGDERDVMIFSVGYGYDRDGKITMNFGPLNKPGGERRLNVAITRAREKVIIVSSIRYLDFDLSATQAPGVISLYYYLLYAEKRREAEEIEETVRDESTWVLIKDVLDAIKDLGYNGVPMVGSSIFRVDIGVQDPKNPEKYVLGILCDGKGYASASTARDRDRLRQQILESLGWRIYRIWTPDWVQNRNTSIRNLHKAIEEAILSKKTRTPREMKPLKTNEFRQIDIVEARSDELPEVTPYSLVELTPRRDLRTLLKFDKSRFLQGYISEVRNLLPRIVSAEGPIHSERAQRRINSCLGLKRNTPY